MRYIIRFALFIGLFVHNALPLLGAVNTPDTSKRRIDTVYVTASQDQVLKNYAEILEKTNQQLGVWSNPYGIMIAALGVLFTIATIIAAVVIYAQSRDFRSKMNQLIAKHDGLLNGLIEERRIKLEEMDQEAKKQLEELNVKFEKATGKQKAEIKKAISSWEKAKEHVEAQLSEPKLKYYTKKEFIHTIGKGLGDVLTHCPNCGAKFYDGSSLMLFDNTKNKVFQPITCPKCGYSNSYI